MAAKNLVIVESPAKAKTIEKFLGKDFSVRSSYGHIRDLPSKEMGVAIDNNFEPTYTINDDKRRVISDLKKEAKGKEVWLASDEDREGEAIAWHVCIALDLDTKKTKRIVFHEITKNALESAVKNPRTIDENLVNAQQARRVLDRLVGYELSPVLWKKIQKGLSAGRVQSVAVRIIVDREREIESFESKSDFRVLADFSADKKNFSAELSTRPKKGVDAEAFMNDIKSADFSVQSVEKKPGKKSPAAPFTTSTLQQEASRKLGFSVRQTMTVAQRLYESGAITYMRTDSVNLSRTAIGQATKVIESEWGKKYVETRQYKTKSKGAQEAHEAIRPTNFGKQSVSGERNEMRLYELIWKRAIASQMATAEIEKTTVHIDISTTRDENFIAMGEVVTFDGFLTLYQESNDDESVEKKESQSLPALKKGEKLSLQKATAKETFSRPPTRYTEASLVKKLEEMGIGRPSTYAPTIATIQDRQYIEKTDREPMQRTVQCVTLEKNSVTSELINENFGAEKSKLFPTETGVIVNDFLIEHFQDILDYKFTANVEEKFDAIEAGEKKWQKVIADFYAPFHTTIEKSADIKKADTSAIRELGTDPATGEKIFARLGRFGPMLQLGEGKTKEDKPKFTSIPKDETIASITLEKALALFAFPRNLGAEKGEDITVNLGRFGPYVKHGKVNASIPKDMSPTDITKAQALQLLADRERTASQKIIWEEGEISLRRGPFGIYIKNGTQNVRIPKTVEDPEKLTLKEAQEIIAKAPEKKSRFQKKK